MAPPCFVALRRSVDYLLYVAHSLAPCAPCLTTKKSPGAIFRERSEPEGRVSGMIRAKCCAQFCRHFRRSLTSLFLRKPPNLVILAGRRGSSYGYVVTRSVTQPRRKPRYFGGEAAGCVRLRRTHILTGFPLRSIYSSSRLRRK